MSELKKKRFFSLKFKLILSVNFLLISMAIIIMAQTTELIYKDKKAYIYGDILKSTRVGSSTLIRSFENKKKFAQLITLLFKKSFQSDQIKNLITQDKDIFQFGFLENNESGLNIDTLYSKSKVYDHYRSNINFLDIQEETLHTLLEKVDNKKMHVEIINSKNRISRLFIITSHQASGKKLFFDFTLDNILNESFSHTPLDIIITTKPGKILFNNKPYNRNENFITDLTSKLLNEKDLKQLRVKEIKIQDVKYIWSTQELPLFNNYIFMSGIKKETAFEITNLLILQSIMYVIFFIGIITLISLVLTKAITKPLTMLADSMRIVSTGQYDHKIQIHSNDEFHTVANSFNNMIDTVNAYGEKLKEYNRTLEHKVKERTNELQEKNNLINSMLNNLTQGFMVFNHLGVVNELYTKACEQLFSISPKNQSVPKILNYDEKETQRFDKWNENIFKEIVPFDSLKGLANKEIRTHIDDTHDHFKCISLEYFPIRNSSEEIKLVILVATNKTKEYKANKLSEEQKDFIDTLSKVIKNQESFEESYSSFRKKLIDFEREGICSEKLLILLHSIKGVFLMYGFKVLAEDIHKKEELLKDKNLGDTTILQVKNDSIEIIDKHSQNVMIYINNLKNNSSTDKSSLIMAFLKNNNKEKLILEIENFITYTSFTQYMEVYQGLVQQLGSDLGKAVAPISVNDNGLMFKKGIFDSLFESFVHIFRNIMDHAIEDTHQREISKKPAKANISISAQICGDSLTISISDDGQGISPCKIRNKLKELNYSEQDINKPDSELLYHIFDEQFTTAEKLTQFSGRGVGLSEVKNQVTALGGFIEIQSVMGKGTCFTLFFPDKPQVRTYDSFTIQTS